MGQYGGEFRKQCRNLYFRELRSLLVPVVGERYIHPQVFMTSF